MGDYRTKEILAFIGISCTRSSNILKCLNPVANTLNLTQRLEKQQGRYEGNKIRVYLVHSVIEIDTFALCWLSAHSGIPQRIENVEEHF